MADAPVISAQLRASLARWAVWLAVFSTIVLLPGALNRWVSPKEAVLGAACVLASLLVASGRLPRWMWIIVGLGGVILLAGALGSTAPIAQLFGRFPRYEGLVTLPVYVGALWLGARLFGPASTAIASFRAAVALASIALGTVSIAEALGFSPLGSPTGGRAGALLGNATDQGVVAVMFFAVLVVAVIRSWVNPPPVAPKKKGKRVDEPARPWLAAVGVVAAVATVIVSASRAALIALVIVLVGLAILELLRGGRSRRVPWGFIGASIGTVAVLALVFPLAARRVLGLTPLASATIDDRVLIYQGALDVAKDHLALGVGPSGFVDAVPAVLADSWYASVGEDTTLDSPHNWMLQALVAGGIPLLVAALTLAALVAVVGFNRWRSAAADQPRRDHLAGAGLAVLGFGVALMTHFTSPGTTILAALLIGSLVAVPPTPRLDVAAGFARLGRTGVLALWAIVLVVTALSELPLQTGAQQLAAGNVTGAKSSFDTALALRPWDADASSIAAQLMAQAADTGSPEAAPFGVDYAERALALTPDSIQAQKALAVGQQYSQDLAGARQTLARLAERVPLDAGVQLRLGIVLAQLELFDEAEAPLLRATQLSPDDPDAWQALAYVYERLGEPEKAQSAAQMQASLTP